LDGTSTRLKEIISGYVEVIVSTTVGAPITYNAEKAFSKFPGYRGLPANVKTEMAVDLMLLIRNRVPAQALNQAIDDLASLIADGLGI
jgi:hypothetical protein